MGIYQGATRVAGIDGGISLDELSRLVRIVGVITELDGKKVSDAGQLQMEVGEKRPGSKVTLQVMRDGKNVSVPLTLEERGGDRSEKLSAENNGDKPRWGLGIGDITPELREQLRAPEDLHGAVIQRVLPGSPSDDAGLQPGQGIMGVNRHETKSASDVQKALAKVPKGQDALVLIWANGGSTFRVLHSTQGA